MNIDNYVAPKIVADKIHHLLGGPLVGGSIGYGYGGDTILPEQGGTINLVFNEIRYKQGCFPEGKPIDTRPILTIEYDLSAEAVTWYKRLNPNLATWQAPTNSFRIEGEDVTEEIIEAVRNELSGSV